MTQTEMIRAHLESGREITPIDALNQYGCFRLAARIDELRRSNMDIETIMETRNGKKFARYRIRQAQREFALEFA
jgi:hypothetical protein